jgi:hypothetical protein
MVLSVASPVCVPHLCPCVALPNPVHFFFSSRPFFPSSSFPPQKKKTSDRIERIAKRAYMEFLTANGLDFTVFPSTLRLEASATVLHFENIETF